MKAHEVAGLQTPQIKAAADVANQPGRLDAVETAVLKNRIERVAAFDRQNDRVRGKTCRSGNGEIGVPDARIRPARHVGCRGIHDRQKERRGKDREKSLHQRVFSFLPE